jgi:hypothetical protein
MSEYGEPWGIKEVKQNKEIPSNDWMTRRIVITNNEGYELLSIDWPTKNQEERFKRIVACVNACNEKELPDLQKWEHIG